MAGLAPAALSLGARAGTVPLRAHGAYVQVADLATARDRKGRRLGIMRATSAPTSFGPIQADAAEDGHEIDCRSQTYACARRTLLLAGAVVRNVENRDARWEANRRAKPTGSSIMGMLERFFALKDVPVR